MAFGEHLAPQRGANPRFDVVGQRGFGIVADGEVVIAVGRTQPRDEPVLGGVDGEGPPESGGGDPAGLCDTKSGEMAGDPVSIGVQALAEKGFHLFFADRRAVRHRPQLGNEGIRRVTRDR